VTTGDILRLPDLGVRAAAIAAAGSAVVLHVRDHGAEGRRLADLTRRFLALAGPPEAAVMVNGHPEIARGCGAQGVQLRTTDLTPRDARTILVQGWIGCSVHDMPQAEDAASNGADFLIAGSVYPTATHPGQAPGGLALVRQCTTLGIPVIAIGGVTVARVEELRDAGAYGVAAVSGLWHAADPAAATQAMLDPWSTLQ
jgi:thiamine-phosphate pyrophosphorylase